MQSFCSGGGVGGGAAPPQSPSLPLLHFCTKSSIHSKRKWRQLLWISSHCLLGTKALAPFYLDGVLFSLLMFSNEHFWMSECVCVCSCVCVCLLSECSSFCSGSIKDIFGNNEELSVRYFSGYNSVLYSLSPQLTTPVKWQLEKDL